MFDASGRVKGFESGNDDAATDTITDLSHLGLLDIRGNDAGEFLHKQFTLDVRTLVECRATMTAWCNPKGRALASFILYRLSDTYGLILSTDLIDTIGKRLRMFVLRADVIISDPGPTQPCIGITGQQAAAGLEQRLGSIPATPWQVLRVDRVTILRLPSGQARFLVTGPADELAELWTSMEVSGCCAAATEQWLLADIEAGLPWITAATSELFLPQMLDLDRTGGLAYDKGCYPGQEVIARLHYRGEVKQRLYRGESASAPPLPGTALYGTDGQRAGTVIIAAATQTGSRILAVAETGRQSLHIDHPAGRELVLESGSAS